MVARTLYKHFLEKFIKEERYYEKKYNKQGVRVFIA